MKIEITHVHLDKENALTFSFIKTEGENRAPIEEGPCSAFVHEDLIDAMAGLDVHLALMTGQLNHGDIAEIETPPEILTKDFHAKSYSVSGADNTRRLTISGNRVLFDKKVFNFNTPSYLLEENEKTRYRQMDDVIKKIDRINKEVFGFMDGTKRGDDPQGNLFAKTNKKEAPPLPSENITADEKKKITKLQIAEPNGQAIPGSVDKEWSAREYMKEMGDEKKVSTVPNVTADPEAMKRVKEWEASEAQNKDKRKAVANQPGAKGRKKGGVKRVKQTAENRSGQIIDPEENDGLTDENETE